MKYSIHIILKQFYRHPSISRDDSASPWVFFFFFFQKNFLVQDFLRRWSVLSRGDASLGGYYGELAAAHTAYPPSPRQWCNQGNDLRRYSLAAIGVAGAAGMYYYV